jgi:predicted small lipoprotein YifL
MAKTWEKSFSGVLIAVFAALLIIFASACGKKGPPIPPGAAKVAPASELEVFVENHEAVVGWKLPDGWENSYIRPDGFIVERAAILPEEDCQNCPVSFSEAGRVDFYQGRRASEKWRFSEEIKKNMVYRYRVVSVGPGGKRAVPSDTAVLGSESGNKIE